MSIVFCPYDELSILLKSYWNLATPLQISGFNLLSILLKSYWNDYVVQRLRKLEKAFNSSKVLLEPAI